MCVCVFVKEGVKEKPGVKITLLFVKTQLTVLVFFFH